MFNEEMQSALITIMQRRCAIIEIDLIGKHFCRQLWLYDLSAGALNVWLKMGENYKETYPSRKPEMCNTRPFKHVYEVFLKFGYKILFLESYVYYK